MLKRIFTALLASTMLLGTASGICSAEGDAALAVDKCCDISISDGKVDVVIGTNASELLACFTDRKNITLTSPNETSLEFTDAISTGTIVSNGSDSVTVIVPGDVNSDAKINVRDVVCALRAIVSPDASDIARSAANVDLSNPNLNAADIIKIMRYIVGWDHELRRDNTQAAVNDDGDIAIYFTSPMNRIAREDTNIPEDATSDGLTRMARNELENVHFIITSTETKSDLTVSVGDLTNANGETLTTELRYGHYYDISMPIDMFGTTVENYYADPYPLLRGPIGIGKNESQSFYLKVTTTAETSAGWYSAPLSVCDKAGNEIKRATIRVYIWDVTLDETPASYTLLGATSNPGYFEITDGDVWEPIYAEKWYEFILANKLSPQDLPYKVLDPRADKYLDDVRNTAFISLSGRSASNFNENNYAATASYLRSTYAKLATKQEWLDKAYIYTVDEPWGASGFETVKTQWLCSKQILGDTFFQTMIPFWNRYVTELERDSLDLMWDYTNAHCPHADNFTEYASFNQQKQDPEKYPSWAAYPDVHGYKKYGDFRPRYEALRERGDKMWWYVVVGGTYPYPTFSIGYQGAWARVLFWQQYNYDVDGFLYYSACNWQLSSNDSRKINLKRTNGGGGLLLYPGSLWDEGPVPVPSMRFECIRDGLEDFQYLRQLERLVDRDDVLSEYSLLVSEDILHFTRDYNDIETVRERAGFMLESFN